MFAESISRRTLPSDYGSTDSGPMTRIRRILDTKLRYVDHPSFSDPTATDMVVAPSSETDDDGLGLSPEPPGRPDPVPTSRSGAKLLTRDQEVHLFRKMNALKSRADRLKERLDPDRPSPADLDEIERLLSEALAVKNRIVESNLRLVVSIAKTRVRSGYGLPESVSDGTLALIQAVDGFDFARGNKFSTYATWAIRNQLARERRRSIRGRGQSLALCEAFLAASESGIGEHEREEVRDKWLSAVRRWLARLDPRERRILTSHYGIGDVPGQTLRQIARQLGITKERVRQIEDGARAKLRKWARLEGMEPLEI